MSSADFNFLNIDIRFTANDFDLNSMECTEVINWNSFEMNS